MQRGNPESNDDSKPDNTKLLNMSFRCTNILVDRALISEHLQTVHARYQSFDVDSPERRKLGEEISDGIDKEKSLDKEYKELDVYIKKHMPVNPKKNALDSKESWYKAGALATIGVGILGIFSFTMSKKSPIPSQMIRSFRF